MGKIAILILVAGIVLLAISLFGDTRFAAPGGAFLLFGVILYGWARNKGGGKESVRKAERGAAELREEIAHEPEKTRDL